MTDEMIDRLFAALDEAFQPYGYPTFDKAFGEVSGWFVQLAETLLLLQNRDEARRWLQRVADPEPWELEQALQLLPSLVYKIRSLAPEVVKKIPHDPGGRPEVSTLEERRKICAEIEDLKDRGYRLGFIYDKIAKRYEVSRTTIQRIWYGQQKQTLDAKPDGR